MHAKECAFYTACRAQRQMILESEILRPSPNLCWALSIGCEDAKPDMDRRCRVFRARGAAGRTAAHGRPCAVSSEPCAVHRKRITVQGSQVTVHREPCRDHCSQGIGQGPRIAAPKPRVHPLEGR